MPRLLIGILFLAVGLTRVVSAADIDFNRDVRPILSNNCYACHGPDEKERKAKLRLDTAQGAKEALGPDGEFLKRITTTEPDEMMPPPKTGKKLTAAEVATLTAWVKQGGRYATHWAYVAPKSGPIPTPRATIRNPIDAYLFARLEQVGLEPQSEADRPTLARRVALDLTGLPPTIAEVEAFVRDPKPDAYERYVDRMLAKPAFGEHWARMWLDLARYADSAGYADDPARTIWAYRDYVIRSFQSNKPFDQFTLEQLAGDLLPNPTEEQLVATAFHRNTMTNNEGGTSDEEFRNVAVVDRLNTTFAVWMGTSVACAQCHTHKYDPITQKEYFELFAFLNNTEDADRTDEAPVLSLGDTATNKSRRAALEKQVAQLDASAKFQPALIQASLRIQTDRLKKQIDDLKPKTTVPILRERPTKRVTRLQFRGNYQELGDPVTENVPAVFHPLPADAPKNRLALARWLVDPQNPLTARVTVNRFWEEIFGQGLVRTSEEFGTQGDPPTHPELLDWLAIEFQSSNWDVKKLLKQLVTSAAYRQSSRTTPQTLEKDSDNRLISRGPRFRMPAEVVRDQALAVSGLLSPKMYGPSVKPPQPAFGLSAAFGRSMDWQTSPGEDKYRRGLYTEWRRTNPYPSMATFDAPSREACTIRRGRSNTPLQALVTLNDPVFVEAAQALGRTLATAPGTTREKIQFGFRTCVSRTPSEAEVDLVLKLYTDAHAKYAKDLALATKMATEPLGPAPKNAKIPDLAAWTVVGNVLLNLDEMILRR